MPKMNKRQIIILAIMVIALIYGAYDLFFASALKKTALKPTETADDLQAFIQQVTADVAIGASGAADVYAIGRAESEWIHDPFANKKIYREWASMKEGPSEAVKGSEKALFNYMGFLDTGKRRMAIINGMEYREGEALDIKGYVLKSVSPSNVVIENRGIGATVNVPLLE